MGYSQHYLRLQTEFMRDLVKANESVTTSAEPGKNRPRWFASLRNVGKSVEKAKVLNYDTQPLVDKAHEAFHNLISQ